MKRSLCFSSFAKLKQRRCDYSSAAQKIVVETLHESKGEKGKMYISNTVELHKMVGLSICLSFCLGPFFLLRFSTLVSPPLFFLPHSLSSSPYSRLSLVYLLNFSPLLYTPYRVSVSM
jgi:hypothetical protein